jgi:hypothetical protein
MIGDLLVTKVITILISFMTKMAEHIYTICLAFAVD